MSETAQIFGETLRRLFEAHGESRPDRPQGLRESSLWRMCVELGLHLTLVSEAEGGVGGTWRDVASALQQVGAFQIALPIAETMLGARVLSSWGVALSEESISVCTRLTGEIRSTDSQPRFSGELQSVPWGRDCDTVVATLGTLGALTGIVLKAPPARVVRRTNLAGEARDFLFYEDSPVIVRPCESAESRALLQYCALARSAQVAGCLQAALVQTAAFATGRRQFGRAISQFQAIQQQMAVCGSEVAAVSAAVEAAARAADAGDAGFQIACAKLRANRAIGVCTGIFHQVHGAIGFTEEHSLHRATQRLWSWRSEYGNDRYWSERLGGQVARGGQENFWADLTSRDDAALSG